MPISQLAVRNTGSGADRIAHHTVCVYVPNSPKLNWILVKLYLLAAWSSNLPFFISSLGQLTL